MIVIGIDPGMSTGVAIYRDGVLAYLTTINPWDIAGAIHAIDEAVGLVVFEDSRLQSHCWTTKGTAAQNLKMARNIGEVDAWCKLIEAMCDGYKIPCKGISPQAKGAKLNSAKFAALTEWTGRSNQHERDAAAVAWPYRHAKK